MATLEVTLTCGEIALIDESSFPLVSAKRWYATYQPDGRVYVATSIRTSGTKSGWTTAYMHRVVTGANPGEQVDHINHNGLDNRRANLRICTNAQNGANRCIARIHAQTGYIGVYPNGRGRYRARLEKDTRFMSFGTYDTPEEAARARDAAARMHFGEFAALNFPDETAA